MAQLIRRDFRPGLVPYTSLSFVADVKATPRKTRRSFWNVPHTEDYGHANSMGRQYACELVQHLKDTPCLAGSNILGCLLADMAAHPRGTAMRGYEVGFWTAIEVMLHRSACQENHWDVIQTVQDSYDAINAAREAETTTEGENA